MKSEGSFGLGLFSLNISESLAGKKIRITCRQIAFTATVSVFLFGLRYGLSV